MSLYNSNGLLVFQIFLYFKAPDLDLNGAIIRLTSKNLVINGRSSTIGSIRNSLKYLYTSNLVGAFGVPRFISKIPDFPIP